MGEVIINKKSVAEAAKAALGGSFVNFLEKADQPKACSVCAVEDLEDSGWAGAWTECLRKIVYEKSPEVQCVCVKPLQFGQYVWYRVEVA